MPVKKIMPKGGRKPTKTLWAMVRGLTEDEWKLVKAYGSVFGKGSLQLQLLELLRSMETYDPQLEKEVFANHNLGSLRSTTKFWLIRTASKLAFYWTEVGGQVLDLDVLLRWGVHDETMETIAEAKRIALEQEEFAALDTISHQEIAVIKILYQGEERSQLIQAAARKAADNARMLVLKAEIEEMVAKYLEHGRNQLLESGHYNSEIAKEYFASKFCKQKIDGWPLSFQIEKLRIDEALHYFIGNTSDAAKIAERILLLTRKLEKVRLRETENESRIMFRLSAYYTDLGDRKKLMGVIDRFRKMLSKQSPYRMNYLRRAVNTLFNAAFEFEIPELADEGLQIWISNQDELLEMPKDVLGLRALYLLCFHQVSVGRIQEARKLLGRIQAFPKINTSLPMQVEIRIVHLVLLLEDGDERGLESFGKNYKRHLKALLPSSVAEAGLEVVKILCKSSNLEGKAKMHESLNLLLEKLKGYQQSADTTFKPFVYPLILWAELKLRA